MTTDATSPPNSPHDYCQHCGYDLTGLSDNRCPECGKAFNLVEIRRQFPDTSLDVVGAIWQTLQVPLMGTGMGAFIMLLARALRNWEGVGVLVLPGVIGAVVLTILASQNAQTVAKSLAVARARRLSLPPFGSGNRVFFSITRVGLFCCQVVLTAAGFFGGCVCSAIALS